MCIIYQVRAVCKCKRLEIVVVVTPSISLYHNEVRITECAYSVDEPVSECMYTLILWYVVGFVNQIPESYRVVIDIAGYDFLPKAHRHVLKYSAVPEIVTYQCIRYI